jgi:hypothetical protein
MYAHQVIEDITKQISSLNELEFVDQKERNKFGKYDKQLLDTLRIIPLAQQFHIGEVSDLFDVVGKIEQTNKFPYPIMWIEFFVRFPGQGPSKGSVLLSPAKTGGSALSLYLYYQPTNLWGEFPGMIKLDQEGKLADVMYTDGFVGVCSYDQVTIELAYYVFFAVIKLLNCKNISTETIKAPEALNKKRRKNGKQEIFDYHVLNVTVPGHKQDYREVSEPLSHVRVHLCRGHFKEYTREHPLFGKLTGLYWWQPHVRGQNRDGIILKDYQIKNKEVA